MICLNCQKEVPCVHYAYDASNARAEAHRLLDAWIDRRAEMMARWNDYRQIALGITIGDAAHAAAVEAAAKETK